MNNSWAYLDRNDNDRDWQRTDTIYVTPDGGAFWTPDGEGRYWYETKEEAAEDSGLSRFHHFDE